jgi:acetylornithine/succinyldiaminopimelate/putrescine aminotransferase
MMEKAANAVKMDALGTTFGAGPMAAAAIEATIDAIESEGLLANVRRVSDYIRKTCIVGPITGHQGAGFLTGLISKVPASVLQEALLADHNILTGTSGDPNVLRLLPPFILKEAEVDLLAAALKRLG